MKTCEFDFLLFWLRHQKDSRFVVVLQLFITHLREGRFLVSTLHFTEGEGLSGVKVLPI